MINQAERVREVINHNASLFDSPETITVEPACEIAHGHADWDRPFIRVVARQPSEVRPNLPQEIDGIPVRVVAATMEEQAVRAIALQQAQPSTAEIKASAWRDVFLTSESEAPRNYELLTYEPLAPSRLVLVTEPMRLTLNVSPDAGWPTLRNFLTPARDWKIAMFDFTARHIYDQLCKAAGSNEDEVSLCLGPNESGAEGSKPTGISEPKIVEGLRDQLGGRFHFAWASVGSRRQFPTAYHIKVAVRDHTVLWLSSGNWQSTNQPRADYVGGGLASGDPLPATLREMARANREWHIVVENATLGQIFADYIEKDRASAAAEAEQPGASRPADDSLTMEFVAPPSPMLADEEAPRLPRKIFPALVLEPGSPVSVQPILTPDNYANEVIGVIRRATKRLWFQNQSLVIGRTTAPRYRELLDALRAKCWELDDARIIIRDLIRPQTLDVLRLLGRDGFPMHKVRVMKTCHTKGILVDSRWTLLGSHNWTNEGTLYNRDASLLIDEPQVAAYYEEVLDHDWRFVADSLTVDLETPSATVLFPGEALVGDTMTIDPRLDKQSVVG